MATTSDVRQFNRTAVLRSVASRGSANRSQIGADCQMSQATVGRILEDLRHEQLVSLEDPTKASGEPTAAILGRPVRNVVLDRSVERFLLVEVGIRQTSLSTAPADISRASTWKQSFPTPSSAGKWKANFAAAYRALGLERRPDAVAISLPGVVDEAQSRVLLSPNLHWSESVDFQRELHALTEAPVTMIQETRALALGQNRNPGSPASFLLVDFGTGLGAAAMIDGKPYRGPLPLSGEIGHIPVEGNSRQCGCGGRGCLETLLGRRYLLDAPESAKTMDDLARSIDADGIMPWLEDRLSAAAHTIAGALNLLGLNRVILTGYIGDLPAVVTERLHNDIVRSSLWARFGQIHVETAPRRRLGGLAAAAFDLLLEKGPARI